MAKYGRRFNRFGNISDESQGVSNKGVGGFMGLVHETSGLGVLEILGRLSESCFRTGPVIHALCPCLP